MDISPKYEPCMSTFTRTCCLPDPPPVESDVLDESDEEFLADFLATFCFFSMMTEHMPFVMK
eukprot:3412028-Prymnesium_polylepis.1